MYVCGPHCLVCTKARRGHQSLWDWSYTQVSMRLHVGLETKLGPLQVKQVLAMTEPSLRPFCCVFLTTTPEGISSCVYTDLHSLIHQLSSECMYMPETVLGVLGGRSDGQAVVLKEFTLHRGCRPNTSEERRCTAQEVKITP